MQKSLLALCLAFAGCGSCSDASSASSGSPSPPSTKPTAQAAPSEVKPALPDTGAKPDPDRKDRMRDRSVKLDTNGDGVISDDERAEGIHRRAVQMHARLDKDGDGKVTQAELEASGRFAHRLGDLTKIDANHDGEISVDELELAFKARYEQWKTHAGSGSAAQP